MNIKVYGYIDGIGRVIELSNTLLEFEKFVGGHIERLPITPDLDIVFNKSGKALEELKPEVAWIVNEDVARIIYGQCFICRHSEVGIREEDIKTIKKILIGITGILTLLF